MTRLNVPVDLPWQLKNPFPIAPFNTLSERLQVVLLITVALEDPTLKVEDVFPVDLVENYIHIIVQLPGKCE